MPSFQVGDVVVRIRTAALRSVAGRVDGGTLGTVCKVVTPGQTYRVIYAGQTLCAPVFHDSIRAASQGDVGPECPDDC